MVRTVVPGATSLCRARLPVAVTTIRRSRLVERAVGDAGYYVHNNVRRFVGYATAWHLIPDERRQTQFDRTANEAAGSGARIEQRARPGSHSAHCHLLRVRCRRLRAGEPFHL